MVRLVYFAWVRERIGRGEEEIELPAGIDTVGDLLAHLRSRGEGYESALAAPEVIRVALDQRHSAHEDRIGDAREIALFPPMTGG